MIQANQLQWLMLHCTVPSVTEDISASGVRTSITSQIQISTDQLNRLSLSTHRYLVPPNILRFRRNEIADLCVDIPRTNRISPRELHPLHSQ